MSIRTARRLAPCLLAAALAVPLPAAALDPQALFSRLRGFLAALWTGESSTSRSNGCEIEPQGLGCAPVLRDNGCEVDPSGLRCAPIFRDNGCEADPDGRCLH